MTKPKMRVRSGSILSGLEDPMIGTWSRMPKAINQTVYEQARIIRARSREQAHNNDYIKRYQQLLVNNVVGSRGIKIQAKSKKPNGELDKLDNQTIERHFTNFSNKKSFDFYGKQSFKGFQNLIMKTLAHDGEVFIVKTINRAFEYGLKFHIVDTERVDITYNAELTNGNLIVMGIEYNPSGLVVAYHFASRLKSAWESYEVGSIKYTRITEDRVIHIYNQDFVGQLRGLPWVGGSLYRLKLVDQYENTALIASKLGAATSGHYYRDENAGNYSGDEKDGYFSEEVVAGEKTILPEGYRYEQFDPTYPQAMYPDFMKKTLMGISSGLNTSYNMLAQDMENVNFSSIRASVLEDRETYKNLQSFLIDEFIQPVFDAWLKIALLNGKIVSINNKQLPFSKIDKFSEVTYQARQWEWVDPFKDARAKIELLNSGVNTLSAIIRDTGQNPEDVFDERLRELEQIALIKEKEAEIYGNKQDSESAKDNDSNSKVQPEED